VSEQAEKTRKVTKDTEEEKTEPRADEGASSSTSPSQKGAGGSEGSEEKPGILPAASEEDEMSVYPLREPSEDARWAVRTVWIWIGFGIASLIFIATLLILGAMYD
jgi:hypothetical protein